MAKIYGNPITFGGSSNKSDFQLVATFDINSDNISDTYTETTKNAFNEYTFGTFQIPFPITVGRVTYNSYSELRAAAGKTKNILFSAFNNMGPRVYVSNSSIDQSSCRIMLDNNNIFDIKLYMFVKFEGNQ